MIADDVTGTNGLNTDLAFRALADGKAARFFGGETWTYYRIAGGKSSLPLFNFSPNQCQITLKFDKEEKLSDYGYSGC